MSITLEQRARVVLTFAERVQTDQDSELAAELHAAVTVIVGRDPGEFWTDLLDAVDRLHGAYLAPTWQGERDLAEQEVIRSLWAVLNGTRLYCPVCVDSRPGEPYQIAAATLPVWGELQTRRGKACEPHCREDWQRAEQRVVRT